MSNTSAVELLGGLIKMGDRESRDGKWRVSLDYDNVHDGARVLDGDEEVLGFCYDSPPEESGIPLDDEQRCIEWQFCRAIGFAMENFAKKIDASRESVPVSGGDGAAARRAVIGRVYDGKPPFETPVIPIPGLVGPASLDVKIPAVPPDSSEAAGEALAERYDMSIHSNPDARAWARFFMQHAPIMQGIARGETERACWVDESLMIGWFANAMCAQHDHDARKAAAERGRLMVLIESWRTDRSLGGLGEISNMLPDLWELRQEHASQLATALQLDEASREFPKPPAQVPMSPGRRDALGKLVRTIWIQWAKLQPEPKPSWLVEWEALAEPDREVDRLIGESLYAVGYCDGSLDVTPFDTALVSDLPIVKFYELRGSFPRESPSGPFVDTTDYLRLEARYKAQISEIASHKRGILAAMQRDENRLEKISKFRQIAWLIGSIYFYGNFKAETHNERMLEARLRELGYFFTTEEQLLGVRPADLPL